ncbi:hypothetical protein [Spirillospora albida]|uniref:hypothetical protein n=1 Tax=Spirillospora albida TaxID=58123 RepID=UPI0004BF228F|nr:hypothetical protein [Spirillospora albida]
MSGFERGWTVFCTESVSDVLTSLPEPVHDELVERLCALAEIGGGAIAVGLPPPGAPLDDVGVHYSYALHGLPAIAEYLVMADIREFRIVSLTWAG